MSIEIVKGLWDNELFCKCGKSDCKDPHNFSHKEMVYLQRISDARTILGIRMNVNSYKRCLLHPYYRETSGHSLENGTRSLAMDIRPIGCTVEEFYLFLEKRGFNGLGINRHKGFVHVDDKPGRIARWYYDEDNVAQSILYKGI